MFKFCVLGKWFFRYFYSFFRIFYIRFLSVVLGKSKEGSGYRVEKVVGFFFWLNLGIRGFIYVRWVRKFKVNRIIRVINILFRVWF